MMTAFAQKQQLKSLNMFCGQDTDMMTILVVYIKTRPATPLKRKKVNN
jgi:hypothetical protein